MPRSATAARSRTAAPAVALAVALAAASGLAAAGCADPAPVDDGPALRLATYNIQFAATADLDALAAAIALLGADVIGVQEVDRFTARSGGVDQAAELAARLGLAHAFAVGTEWDGGEFGVALLSRHPIAGTRAVALAGADESRVLLIADVALPGGAVLPVAVTHLGLTPATRAGQAAAILDALADEPVAALLADLNGPPDEEGLAPLFEAYLDAWAAVGDGDGHTYSAKRPSVRIDYVLVERERLPPVAARVDEVYASDHRPVVVRASLPD